MKLKLLIIIFLVCIRFGYAQLQAGCFLNANSLGINKIGSLSINSGGTKGFPGLWFGYEIDKIQFELRFFYNSNTVSTWLGYDDYYISGFSSKGYNTDFNSRFLQLGLQCKLIGNYITINGGVAYSYTPEMKFKYEYQTIIDKGGANETIHKVTDLLYLPSNKSSGPYIGSGFRYSKNKFIIRSEISFAWLFGETLMRQFSNTEIIKVNTNQVTSSSVYTTPKGILKYGYASFLLGIGYNL